MSAGQSINGSESRFQRLVPHLKTAALIVTILGAIPTAITAYNAYRFGVPFSQVSERLAQYDLWVKNLDCKIEYKALSTAQGTKVDAGACPKTGDIALKISTADGKSTYQWIAYNELQKPGEPPPSGGLLDILIGAARADTADKPVQLAQGALEVVCQALISPKELIRVVKEGGKCFRETMSPVRGSVDKRDEVPCDTKCPGAG
jgi:hypothetical protein